MEDFIRPEQRKVMARILTPSGWIVGTFHVPVKQPLLEFLNQGRPFFTLTGVLLPGSSERVDFMGLQRQAAVLVIPADNDELIDELSRQHALPRKRSVECLFAGGMLHGTMSMPEKLRVSDALMSTPGFFALSKTTTSWEDEKLSVGSESLVIVHSQQILGVSEQHL